MVDPLSIAAAASSLVMVGIRVGKALNDIRRQYASAPIAIGSMATECSVIGAVLSRMQQIALSETDPLYEKFEANARLSEVFDGVLLSCATTFNLLEEEVSNLGQDDRLKFMLNENTMMEYLGQLRGLGQAINTLLLLMQSEALADIHTILLKNQAGLDDVVENGSILRERAESQRDLETIRSTSWAEVEVGDADSGLTQFEFDETLRNTAIYRRASERSSRMVPTRLRELERQVEQSQMALVESKCSYNARDRARAQAAKRLQRERVTALERNYRTTITYIHNSEKVVGRMKTELVRCKAQNAALHAALEHEHRIA
ncbi:hypothetical protein MMC07_008135 [Pseudocyphellaria aurata]|nr:hypothetical protein [Pseudocyphellaria aurata]